MINNIKVGEQPTMIKLMMGISWRFPFHYLKHLNAEKRAGEFVVYYPGDFWVRYYSKERRYVGQIHRCYFNTTSVDDIIFMLEHEGDVLMEEPDNLNELRRLIEERKVS